MKIVLQIFSSVLTLIHFNILLFYTFQIFHYSIIKDLCNEFYECPLCNFVQIQKVGYLTFSVGQIVRGRGMKVFARLGQTPDCPDCP